jgi:hypothetical protein
MKLIKSLLFCMAISTPAAASSDWIARISNRAGGLIVFLPIKASCSQGLRLYASTSSGLVTWGCWMALDNHVMVFWDEGEQRTSAFPYSSLEMNPAFEQRRAPATKSYNF